MILAKHHFSVSLFTVVAALALSGCGKKSDNGSNTKKGVNVSSTIPDMGELMFTLPPAVTGSTTQLRLAPGESNDGLTGMIMMPRQMLAVSNMMITMIREVADRMFGKAVCLDDDASNDPANCSEYMGVVKGRATSSWKVLSIPSDANDSGAPNAVKFRKNPDGSAFDYTFYLYWKNAADNLYYPGMEFSATKTEDGGKGEVVFSPAIMPSEEGDEGGGPAYIKVAFDGDSTEKSMHLWFGGMEEEGDINSPSKMELTVTSNGTIVTGAGAFIRNASAGTVGEGPKPFSDFEHALAYSFKVAAYVDPTQDKGLEMLAAMSEDDFAATDPFTTNSLGKVMEGAIIGMFRDNADQCPTFGTGLNTIMDSESITHVADLPANICTANTSVSNDAVFHAISSICELSAEKISGYNWTQLCAAVNLYTPWTNPIYMNAAGLVGTGSWQTPTTGYNDLLSPLLTLAPINLTALHAWTAPTLTGVETVE